MPLTRFGESPHVRNLSEADGNCSRLGIEKCESLLPLRALRSDRFRCCGGGEGGITVRYDRPTPYCMPVVRPSLAQLHIIFLLVYVAAPSQSRCLPLSSYLTSMAFLLYFISHEDYRIYAIWQEKYVVTFLNSQLDKHTSYNLQLNILHTIVSVVLPFWMPG